MKKALTLTSLLILPFEIFAEPLIIGVAEEETSRSYQKPVEIIVRPLFVKDSDQWVALDSPRRQSPYNLKQVEWLVTFDGRKLGDLISVQVPDSYDSKFEWTFPRDFHHRIQNLEEIPKLGNKENRFGRWNGIPKNRPVILVRNGGHEDPEGWKRFKPKKEYLEMLFPLLKDLIKKPYHCNGAPNWGATPIENLSISDVDLYRSYKNSKDQYLISAGMSEKHLACDGPISPEDKPIWFFLSGSNTKLVGYELDLLDVADYDKDGVVEFIFWHGSYNEDGYSLYDDNFEKHFDYFWSYH